MEASLPTFVSVKDRFPPLQLPPARLRLARRGAQIVVWDVIRKKYLVLTPEEWVRQHFVHYLLSLGYPASNLALESGLYQQKNLLQRSDILAYKNGRPVLLVECKAPYVPLGQNTMDQAARYNRQWKAPYLGVTNGLRHLLARINYEAQRYEWLEQTPAYQEL